MAQPADEGAGAAAHTPLPIPRVGRRIGRRPWRRGVGGLPGRRGRASRAVVAGREQRARRAGMGGGVRACGEVAVGQGIDGWNVGGTGRRRRLNPGVLTLGGQHVPNCFPSF